MYSTIILYSIHYSKQKCFYFPFEAPELVYTPIFFFVIQHTVYSKSIISNTSFFVGRVLYVTNPMIIQSDPLLETVSR